MRRRLLPLLVVAALCVLLFVWLAFPRHDRREPADPGVSEMAPLKGQPMAGRPQPAVGRVPPTPRSPATAEEEDSAAEQTVPMDGLVPAEDMDAMAEAWSLVDLDEVRRAMPGNLFFEISAPTQEEAVLAARQAERARWNVEYGKILSGTGTRAEIVDYYDFRARLSTDYVEFTTYLLDHFGDQIPERDVGLLDLARRLHLARLEEIPRKVEEALERKRLQDEARAAWLADEAAFGRATPDDAGTQ